MSKQQKLEAAVIAVILAGALIYVLTGCAGVPYQRDVVDPATGHVVQETVTEHTVPPTGVVLWKDVEVAGATTIHPEPLWGALEGMWPWLGLVPLLFKRPRQNAIQAVKSAGEGDAATAVKSILAIPGLLHTPDPTPPPTVV